MVAAEGENAFWIRTVRWRAGDAIDGFGAEFLRNQFSGFALDRKDLSGVGELDVTGQLGTGPDAADFDTAVAFIDRGVVRGEKTPVSGRRYLDGEWADCP